MFGARKTRVRVRCYVRALRVRKYPERMFGCQSYFKTWVCCGRVLFGQVFVVFVLCSVPVLFVFVFGQLSACWSCSCSDFVFCSCSCSVNLVFVLGYFGMPGYSRCSPMAGYSRCARSRSVPNGIVGLAPPIWKLSGPYHAPARSTWLRVCNHVSGRFQLNWVRFIDRGGEGVPNGYSKAC